MWASNWPVTLIKRLPYAAPQESLFGEYRTLGSSLPVEQGFLTMNTASLWGEGIPWLSGVGFTVASMAELPAAARKKQLALIVVSLAIPVPYPRSR